MYSNKIAKITVHSIEIQQIFIAHVKLIDVVEKGVELFPSRPADLELALRHCFLDQGLVEAIHVNDQGGAGQRLRN